MGKRFISGEYLSLMLFTRTIETNACIALIKQNNHSILENSLNSEVLLMIIDATTANEVKENKVVSILVFFRFIDK